MESAITLFYQIIKMLIMMMAGYYLYSVKTINDDTTSRLSSILLTITTPCMIISSFNQTYSYEKLQALMVSFVMTTLIYLFNILFAHIMFPSKRGIDRLALAFSNGGFLGIPLVSGLFGIEAVFYLAPFCSVFYVFLWTSGVMMVSKNKEDIAFKKVATNPCIWALILGVVVFLLPVKPFTPVMEALQTLGNMTSPLAMIILGAYIAKSSLVKIFTNLKAYQVSMVRLILIPVLLIVMMKFVPEAYRMVCTVLLVGASAPAAAVVPIFAQMFDKDIEHASQVVCLSTILCLITMPCMLMIAEMIW